MKKKCIIKEAPELELKLKDRAFNIIFSNSLFISYEEEFGDLTKALNENSAVGVCEFFARLLYCYFKYMDEDISLWECKVIILKGSDGLISAMTECLLDAISLTDNEEVKKKLIQMNMKLKLK